MKRFLAVFFLALSGVVPGLAQGSIPLLEQVSGHRVTFHYTYSLSRNGGPMQPVTEGKGIVEDNAYLLEGLGLEVRSDGVTRWSLDPAAREVVIEKVEKEDLFTNPALFIRSYKQYLDRIHVNASGKDSLDVTLVLDDDTSARFVLREIIFQDRQGKSDFPLDEKSLPASYVITDLQ